MKFVEGIRPGDTVQVTVDFTEPVADGSGAKFTIHKDDVLCTTGGMRLAEEAGG